MIDTDAVSERYRAAAFRPVEGRILVTDLRGTEQAQDLSEAPNCGGIGRLRHFRRETSPGWPQPAAGWAHMSVPRRRPAGRARAQVFQNAVCNWRCWYCFVRYNLLAADRRHSRWVTADEIVDLYLREPDPPPVIDLSGGQPDLTPEWVPWMMRALRARGLEGRVYLWSDDNLSNDYFWRHLSDAECELVSSFRGYGRVGCFKGFDPESFAFNTSAAPELFDRQFELMGRLIGTRKQNGGTRWGEDGADEMCHLRALFASGEKQWDAYWRPHRN
ncbi:MAG: hypothetical protein WKF75_15090 [Singulisphaera sp.]